MKYHIEREILKKCTPEIAEKIKTIDGIRVRTQSQELDLIIPEGVISIDKKAFDLVCDYVEAVFFPASLQPSDCNENGLLPARRFHIL